MEPELHRPTIPVFVAAVSTILLVAALIWGVTQARDAAQEGAVAHRALCIQYDGYVAQHKQGLRLLAAQHGPVIHYAGLTITRSSIERSVRLQAFQINALSILNCKE